MSFSEWSIPIIPQRQRQHQQSPPSSASPPEPPQDASAASIPLAQQMLDYLPEYRVVRCVVCRYAVPPSALSRHMKDLHHVYRGKRRALLDYAETLDLADPEDLVLPEPQEPPIPSIPVEDGVACNWCKYLSVTTKRMKRHWVTVHERRGIEGKHWRPVKLQTFFRGNNLRYFIVTPGERTLQLRGQATFNKQADSIPGTNGQGLKKIGKPRLKRLGTNARHSVALCKVPETSDTNETGLTAWERSLFYHYKMTTCPGILHIDEDIFPWLTSIPQLAQQFPFIMHAILSISALHLAFLKPMDRQRCIVTAAHYQDQALQSFRSKISKVEVANSYAMFAFSRLIVLHELASANLGNSAMMEYPDGRHMALGDEEILPRWLKLRLDSFKLLRPYILSGFRDPQQVPRPSKRLDETTPVDWASNPYDTEFAAVSPLFEVDVTRVASSARELMENATCANAFNGLRQAFAVPYATQQWGKFYDATVFWPLKQTERFFELVSYGNPRALIVMAFYCVILHRVENYWFMKGQGRQLLSNIERRLGNAWRHWIQWPLHELEIEGGPDFTRIEEV